MARIAVVGAGAWGTALACHLARLEHAVTMWAYEPEVAEEIATRHTNSPYLPDVSLPETIRASVDPRQVAASADVRSEEHTSELQSRLHLVCRLLLEKKKKTIVKSALEIYIHITI